MVCGLGNRRQRLGGIGMTSTRLYRLAVLRELNNAFSCGLKGGGRVGGLVVVVVAVSDLVHVFDVQDGYRWLDGRMGI